MRLSRILAALAVATAVTVPGVALTAAPASASTAPGLFVVTDYSGAMVRGSGVTGVVRQAAGRYEVRFQRDMDLCSYTASIGGPGNDIVYAPGVVTVASGELNAFRVHVETSASPGGALADFPFHLHAMCPGDENWAVVGGNGTLARSSGAVTSVVKVGAGQYEVGLNRSVTGCAYVATRGGTFTDVAAPGTISTASRSGNPNAIWVETRTIPGVLTDSPFHLNVQCPDPGSTSRWSVVRADGSQARAASLLISSEKIGLGQYRVNMIEGSTYGCAFVAVPGTPGDGTVGQQVLAFTTRDADRPEWAIRVETKNVGGGLTDVPFHLQVSGSC